MVEMRTILDYVVKEVSIGKHHISWNLNDEKESIRQKIGEREHDGPEEACRDRKGERLA